jgi:hypothetical protein
MRAQHSAARWDILGRLVAAETRKHHRYALEVTVRLHDGDRAIEGRTRNLSRGGLSAFVARPVRVGMQVTGLMALVFDGDTTSEPLELPMRIVWCTALGDRHQVGAAFKPMTERQVQFLDVFLRYLEEGEARRRDAEPDPEDPFAR